MKTGSEEKFYENLKNKDNIDPENEERTANMVQSILHTLNLENNKSKNNNGGFKLEDIDREKVE